MTSGCRVQDSIANLTATVVFVSKDFRHMYCRRRLLGMNKLRDLADESGILGRRLRDQLLLRGALSQIFLLMFRQVPEANISSNVSPLLACAPRILPAGVAAKDPLNFSF